MKNRSFFQICFLSLVVLIMLAPQAFALIEAPKKESRIEKQLLEPVVPPPPPPEEMGDVRLIDHGIITEFLRSDLILLDSHKRYKLDNIRIPPYLDSYALQALKTAFLNKKIAVYDHKVRQSEYLNSLDSDRYGVPLVQAVADESTVWVQAYLISKGLAWVYTETTNLQANTPLLEIEESARLARQGMWQYEAFSIKTPDTVKDYIGTFQIVDGVILDAAIKKENVYLNFDKDWKTDFTVRIPKNDWVEFAWFFRGGSDPTLWRGKRVRVRGWVQEYGGPLMEITHTTSLQILPVVDKDKDKKDKKNKK